MAALRFTQRVDVERIKALGCGLKEVDGVIGRRHAVFAERELIELPYAFPLVLAQHVEELEEFNRVQTAGHEIVIPGAIVVVDVHAEQSAVINGQLGAVSSRFAAHDGVTEIEQDAHIWQADLLDAEQGAGNRAEAHANAGLARLVFDDELQVRVFAGELPNAVERMLPQGAVIDLEGVVPPILAWPQFDVVCAKIPDLLAGFGYQFMRTAPDTRVRVGERSFDELARVNLRRDADDTELVTIQRFLHLRVGEVTAEEGIVDVDH